MDSMELQKTLPLSIYEFSLLKTKYVDFKNTVIDKEMIKEDGIILLPLKIHWLPKIRCEITEDYYYFENVREWDECYVVFNIIDGEATGLRIQSHGVLHSLDFCFMATVYYLRHLKHPESEECQHQFDTFNREVMEWLKSLIREIIIEPKGIFKKDFFKQDTYFQLRQDNKEIYYIIYEWWKKLQKGEADFIDVLNNSTVFIANND